VLVDLPARADSQGEPARADVIDGGRPVGQYCGMTVGHRKDQVGQPDPGRGAGQRGKCRGSLQRVVRAVAVRHEVVGDVGGVPEVLVGVPRQFEDIVPGLGVGGPYGESHAASVGMHPGSPRKHMGTVFFARGFVHEEPPRCLPLQGDDRTRTDARQIR